MARLTALWWWIDRWRKSTAFMDMTLEQQGAYRNLLDEAALRGGPLPNDERVLAKACGDALAWALVREAVLAHFVLRPDGWHNETLDAVLAESQRRADKQRNYRNRSGNTSGNGASNKARPPSPSPSPSLISDLRSPIVPPQKPEVRRAAADDGRSNRPIFRCDRFVVFEWLFNDLRQLLGAHLDDFHIDEWFYTLSTRADAEGLMLDKRTSGTWVYAQTVEEAERRGLRVASTRLRAEDLLMPPGAPS